MKTSLGNGSQLLLVISIFLSACGPSAEQLAATSEMALAETQTAAFTSTPSVTPSSPPDGTATAQAMATIMAIPDFVRADLKLTGYTADSGVLAFQQSKQIQLSLVTSNKAPFVSTTLNVGNFLSVVSSPVFSDFVLGVDITWNSKIDAGGCSIYFRGDDQADGKRVVFMTARLSADPQWTVALWNSGAIEANLSAEPQGSAFINQADGSTNHYVVVVSNDTATFYANGEFLGALPLQDAPEEGTLGFEAWQQSGATTCGIANSWVWQLN